MKTLMVLVLGLSFGLAAPSDLTAVTDIEDHGFICGTPGVLPSHPEGAAKPLVDLGGGLPLTHGRVNVLVIFAKFAGEAPHVRGVPDYASALFDVNLLGSFAHFYDTMSAGQLEIQGTVMTRRYEAEEEAEAYLAEGADVRGDFGRFAAEILQKVDRDVDFGLFDNDGPDGVPDSGDDDGVVDYVFLNVLSVPRFFLIDRASGIANLGVDEFTSQDVGHNGEPILILGGSANGAIQQEGSFSKTVGVMAHEFGHRWRLPDLYDTLYEGPVDDSAGIGKWGLMGAGAHGWTGNDGPAAFSAWTLEHLGWIGRDNERLIEVREDISGELLEDLHAGGEVLKIPLLVKGGRSLESATTQEYLLLEQRTRNGSYYNRGIPGEGLLVWHVSPWSGSNRDELSKKVDLVCADGLYQDAGYPEGRLADSSNGWDNLDFWAHRAAYREDHMGNQGDATDPFDGVRFTRLNTDSNPSNNPRGQLSSASTGVQLAVRARGSLMQVGARLPRWAGKIDGEVHWVDDVLIDGDVRVDTGGTLVIHPDTRVRFAGQDRSRGGVDPELVELNIQGDFRILASNDAGKVVFEPAVPDQEWYGIVVDTVSPGIRVPSGSYEIAKGSRFDIVIEGAPKGARGQVLSHFEISDAPDLETAGNGDGLLSPGESFVVDMGLDNWSLTGYQRVLITLGWNTPLVKSIQNPSSSSTRLTLSEPLEFLPGGHLQFTQQLVLSPEAQAGQEIQLYLNFWRRTSGRLNEIDGAESWQDTLSFTVVGDYPDHEVEFEVPGYEKSSDGSITVPLDRAVTLRALVRGDIDGVDLVVRDLPELVLVQEEAIPMQSQPDRGDQRVFEVSFDPPAADLYQLFLRIHGTDGAVVLSEITQDLGAFLISEPKPLLIFRGDHYNARNETALTEMFGDVFEEMGLSAHVFDQAPASGLDYGPILEAGLEEGGVVLWLGQTMDEETQNAFGEFLENGGRLLMASEASATSGSMVAFRTKYLHARTTESGSTVHSLYLDERLEFAAPHRGLELVAPAFPLLLNNKNKPAGLRLDNGRYRVVYLPFDLRQPAETLSPLIHDSISFLRQRAVQEVLLEVPDHELVGQALGVGVERPTPVRATIVGQVERAELVVRSFPQLEPLFELPMALIEEGDDGRVFEIDFKPPDQGQYQLFLRLHTADGQKLIGSTSVRILAVFGDRPVLVMLGDQYTSGDKAVVQSQLNQALGEIGIEVTTIDQPDEDEGFYDALLNQYRDEDELVLWLGDVMDAGHQAAFRRFLERGGRLLLSSYEFTEDPFAKGFREDMLHVGRARPVTSSTLRTLYLSHPVELNVEHHWLELEAPAEPLLLDPDYRPVGLRLDTGVYRTVYMPFDLRRLPEEIVVPLIKSEVSFLQQPIERGVELELDSSAQVGRALAVTSGSPVGVRALVGLAEAVDLIVRTVPQLGAVSQFPMQRGEPEDGKEVFEVEFQPPAPGQYHLSVQLHKADGQHLHSDAAVRVLSLSSGREAVIFFGEHYGTAEKQNLRAQLRLALGPARETAAFVDLGFEEEEFYEALLDQYLEPDGLVVWLGGTMDRGSQVALASFLAGGGRLLMASSVFVLSPGSNAFLRDRLHVSSVLPRRTSTLRTLHLDERHELDVLYTGLEIMAPAEAALLDAADRTAGLRLDSGDYRAVYLPFDLNPFGESTQHPLIESSIQFLQQKAVEEVVLDVPGQEIIDQTVGMRTDSTTTVEARFRGAVEEVELVVRSTPDMTVISMEPMQETGSRDGFGVYEAPFKPPDLEQYHLSLRFTTTDGATLFSGASLRVLGINTDRPTLMLLDGAYTPTENENLASLFEELGLPATVVVGSEGEAFYKALLSQYLDEDEVVLWLGDEMSEGTQEAFRGFLERGGRLFMASLDLATTQEAQTFLSDMLHIAGEPVVRRNELRSAGLLAGPDLSCTHTHVALKRISPPAVPVLLNQDNRAVGLRLDNGTYRVVFLSFDLRLPETLRPLLRATLPFLDQPEFEAALELPEHEIQDHAVLVSPDHPLQVKARVQGAVESAELIVRTQERLEVVAEIPMELESSEGERRVFQTMFQPPARERFQLFLQLRDPEDRPFLAANSLQVNALLFDHWQPILAFLDERFTAAQREKFIADLNQVAGNLGLGVNILNSAPRDESLYSTFLEHYLEEGELVLWFGNILGEEAQDVFRDYMEAGGQLLMASSTFQFSPDVLPFLQDMLQIVDIPKGLTTSATRFRSPDWPEPRRFIMTYMRILPEDSAVPVLEANDEDIVGLRVDTGTYRAVYVSADLKNMEGRPRQEWLESNLTFLHQKAVQGPLLEVKLVLDPAPAVSLEESLVPRIVIANSGTEAASAFRVGYQVLRGETIVGTGMVEESALDAQAQREVPLPAWNPLQEGDYRIRFGTNRDGEQGLSYDTDRRLLVMARQTLFEEVELDGDLNRGNGVGVFDYDQDGDVDFYLVRLGTDDRLLRNDGKRFSEQTETAGLGDSDNGRAVAMGDYDGDGNVDFYLTKQTANRFFRNEGDGTFAEITAELDADPETESPLADEFSGRSAGFFDYDLDGDLDLYLVNAHVLEEGGVNRLFHNEGGVFSERAALVGLQDTGNGRGLAFGDYDGDGQVDVFVANTAGQSRFFHNEAGTFRNVNDDLDMTYASGEIGPAFGDYDSDGDLDLFVANEEGLNQLFRNDGTSFRQIAHEDNFNLGGQDVGTVFADYDNDGDLDLLATTLSTRFVGGDELYQNRDGFLVPVGVLLGLAPKSNGRALSVADIDQDGDLDLFVADTGRTRLYRNVSPPLGHWLQVELEGTELNRHALGARVELSVGERRLVRENQLVYGYCSQASPRLHFGLGAATRVDTLRVVWPGGREGLQLDVAADQLLRLRGQDLTTAIEDDTRRLPEIFALKQNYPNPFNAQTLIPYQLPHRAPVDLTVYNVVGQRVKRLVGTVQDRGRYNVSWQSRDEEGRPVGSGVYIFRLRAGSFEQTRRLLVLK